MKKFTYVVTGLFILVNGIVRGLEFTKETELKQVTFVIEGLHTVPFFFNALFLGTADKWGSFAGISSTISVSTAKLSGCALGNTVFTTGALLIASSRSLIAWLRRAKLKQCIKLDKSKILN